MKKFLVVIAASGTGGHLFPALLIAKALKEAAKQKGCEVEVQFIGSGRPLEVKLIDGSGYRRHVVGVRGVVGRGIKGALQFLLYFPTVFRVIWSLFSELRPALVLGVGGYTSFVPVLAARLRGIPTLIHEAEMRPGLANSVLSIISNRVTVGFERSSIWWRKVEHTGHPVREGLGAVRPRAAEKGAPRDLLIIGGSQGAAALDNALISLTPLLHEKSVRVVHQPRPENLELVRNSYVAQRVESRVESFIEEMAGAYQNCDLIISRSGAASVTEIAAVNRPAIFVPLPSSQGGHQVVNAKFLVDRGKALIVLEGEEFEKRLREALERLLDPEFYRTMLQRPSASRGLDAAQRIAEICFELIRV